MRDRHDTPPLGAAELNRRLALQGLVGFGALLFVPMPGCGPRTPPAQPSAPMPQSQETMMAPREYTLPALPYPYEALEPYIDAETLKLHHDKHHAGYVEGANQAQRELAAARESGDFKLVDYWQRKLAFHGSGHLLHSLYWVNMAPKGQGGAPSQELLTAVQSSFGSLDKMKAQLTAAAKTVEANGWGILAWNAMDNSLVVLQCENHQKQIIPSAVPLLVVDAWEHAYYLKYQNRRVDYLDAWWNVVNWNDVSRRFAKVSLLRSVVG